MRVLKMKIFKNIRYLNLPKGIEVRNGFWKYLVPELVEGDKSEPSLLFAPFLLSAKRREKERGFCIPFDKLRDHNGVLYASIPLDKLRDQLKQISQIEFGTHFA